MKKRNNNLLHNANRLRILTASLALAVAGSVLPGAGDTIHAQGINELLKNRLTAPVSGNVQSGEVQSGQNGSFSGSLPIPQPRPGDLTDNLAASASFSTPTADTAQSMMPQDTSAPVAAASLAAIAPAPDPVFKTAGISAMARTPVALTGVPQVSAIQGSLKDGMDSLSNGNIAKARAIRLGMSNGSLDRDILSWSMAMSGNKGITSGEISQISASLADWPGQDVMRRNAERALYHENLAPQDVIAAFGRHPPETIEGATVLAQAYLASGNRKAANKVLAPFWHTEKLGKSEQSEILSRASAALTRGDHQTRMNYLIYEERNDDGLQMAGLAEQQALAKARVAVNRGSGEAGALLGKAASGYSNNASYLHARVKYLRKKGDYSQAAELLLRAPRDRQSLIDPDAWWVERRIISRELIDMGNPKLAYKIAAAHSAESPKIYSEAEWHAGWYALRFLNNKSVAQAHFKNVLKGSDSPITQARGYYWLGRASGSAAYFQKAASYPGTYYGQLAAQKLGQRALRISQPRPSAVDRARFNAREPVRAIDRLEAIGYGRRASTLYLDLAEELKSPGELALLSARAEQQGNRSLALQVGKVAYKRGLPVDTLAWPVGAIPQNARLGASGTALAYAISRQESAFNVGAVSGADARGLMQLLPGTAKLMANKTGLGYTPARLTSDAAYNATLGSAYLSEQLDKFDNSYILTFAGYNAGPGRSREWVGKYGSPKGREIDDVVDWVERIPFTETRDYVQRVMENYQVYKARLGGSKLDIEGDLRYGRR